VGIHLSRDAGALRQIVLSCDVAGCPVQIQPPPAERWRSDTDASSWARDHAVGWTHDPSRKTDYCPEHAASSVPPAEGTVAPRPTAAARDIGGNPVNRDIYAEQLRAQLSKESLATDIPTLLDPAQSHVVARLLDELAGVYRGEQIGAHAAEMAAVLDDHGA
jgi:hypothetical protein